MTLNENQKTILSYVLCFFLGVSITLAISVPIYISSTRRSNIKSGELSVRLSETERRLVEATTTISKCGESFERISASIDSGNGTLTGIIQSLKQIRDEVQIMEERIYSFDNNSNSDDRNDSVSVVSSE